MVVNCKKILIKIVSICILILFLMQIFKNSTIIFCEMSAMSHEEALNILKESAYCNLYELIRQEDFKSVYGKTWIYANIILEENFLMEFLEKIQWRTFDEETKNMTSEAKLYKINDIFMSYIEHLQLDWLIEYRKKHEVAYKNTIHFCNNLIIQSFNTINNYKTVFPWIIPITITSNMFIHPPSSATLLIFTQTMGSFLDQLDILRMTIPQIPHYNGNNLGLLIQNNTIYCTTPGAWANFLESEEWKTVLNNNNKIIICIGVFITIIVIKSLIS